MPRKLAAAVGALVCGLLFATPAKAADLTVTNSSLDVWFGSYLLTGCDATLSGTLTYDTVTVASDATICITSGSALVINATTITMSGYIYGFGRGDENGDGKGGAAGSDAGGGGGYGGAGADGTYDDKCNPDGAGGSTYGTETGHDVAMGSAGGISEHNAVAGGRGGGAVTLHADTITITGTINVDGYPGSADGDASGGGSGGGVLIEAGTLSCSGSIYARGGSGGDDDDNGGGGGGGRIKQFYDKDGGSGECTTYYTGGDTPDCSTDGSTGTSYVDAKYDYDGDGYTYDEDGDCDPADSAYNPGEPDGEDAGATCDGLDQDCDGNADDETTPDDDCDGNDDDCDGSADEDGGSAWYLDSDGDGYPEYDAAAPTQCDSPGSQYIEARSDAKWDCDDDLDVVNPGEPEACDGIDTNCNGSIDYSGDEVDSDGDGYVPCYSTSTTWLGTTLPDGEDCDDTNAAIHPGATEVCDDVDNDCDDSIDANDTTGSLALDTLYQDADGDGYGYRGTSMSGCEGDNAGYVKDDFSDCDDDNDNVYPGASEICDGVRDDCDYSGVPSDEVDNDTDGYVECVDVGEAWAGSSTIEGYSDCDDTDKYAYPGVARHEGNDCVRDFDGDGYGDDSAVYPVTAGSDCDDERDTVYPQTHDACDGLDTNCADDTDSDHPETSAQLDGLDPEEFDYDGDGYVDCNYDVTTWEGDPSIDGGDDCDDEEPNAYPDRYEECDGIDNDCDGTVDEADAVDAPHWYFDADLDGYGDATRVDVGCDLADLGYVENFDDCNDDDATVYPAATEICDGQRNDCDLSADGIPSDEIDLDNDEYVECGWDGTVTWAGASSIIVGVDCDPSDPKTHPGADEICDGIYNDCDFRDGTSDAPADETDDDGDSYVECWDGTEIWVGTAPEPPVGLDCDDEDATVYPGAAELCDGLVNNCDESADGVPASEVDSDGDGYVECTYSGGSWDGTAPYVGADCAPDDATKYPGAPELCDGQYNDCDLEALSGGTQDAPEDEQDVDGDGYVGCDYDPARATWAGSVTPPDGADCNDYDDTVYPSADEVCDGQFNDCDDLAYVADGAPDDETDNDGDLYIECEVYTTVTWVGDDAILWEDGLLDCDDTDPTAYPGAAESESADACMRDADGDGWGDIGATDTVEPGTDCDDSLDVVHPEADEECEATDQIDNDCDGNVNTEDGYPINDGTLVIYEDADGDGFGDAYAAPVHVCELSDGFSVSATDCDDDNATIHPGAYEVCNEVDEDCDEAIDEPEDLDPEASGCLDLYRDVDTDGYGDADESACLCLTGTDIETEWNGDRYVRTSGDCYDFDAEIRPGYGTTYGYSEDGPSALVVTERTERLDGHDNDCDGYIPIVELDCDDDGSMPLLTDPTGHVVQSGTRFTNAAQVGLASCVEGTQVTVSSCLGEGEITADCDTVTGLWVVRYAESADGFGGRYDGGYRTYADATTCDAVGDCDDACSSRCPGGTEVCDGVDNDCTGVTDVTDVDGVPAAMDPDVSLPGTVPSGEIDIDMDGAYACETAGGEVTGESLHLSTRDCDDPLPISESEVDCDDRCTFQSPEAEERCNGFTDVCDGDPEGIDEDEDGHGTCGAWSGGDLDTEDIFVLVWQDGGTTTSADTSDTGAAATGTTVVPLILPRPEAGTCDQDLEDALVDLVGDEVATLATERGSYEPILDWCMAPTKGGSCEVVRLTLDEQADEQIADYYLPEAAAAGFLDPDCEDHPEALVTRTVWHESRIEAAREAVVDWECRRLYGVDCDRVTDTTPLVTGWDTSRPDLSRTLSTSLRWWKEIGRYNPTSETTGTVMTCWGDPSDEDEGVSDGVGGDCADGNGVANREMPEGPADVVALYWDEPVDCSACLDGVDNNCDGAMDCEDPTCAPCFVGQGLGCGAEGSPCEGGGCSGIAPVRGALGGSPASLAWVASASLAAALLRRRGRS